MNIFFWGGGEGEGIAAVLRIVYCNQNLCLVDWEATYLQACCMQEKAYGCAHVIKHIQVYFWTEKSLNGQSISRTV